MKSFPLTKSGILGSFWCFRSNWDH